MSARWVTCPRCQVRFQTENAGELRCPACNSSFTEGAAVEPSVSYYVVQNKQKIGPLSVAQMRQMSQGGSLKPDDMVLQDGTRTWMPATKVPTLFGDPAAQETVDEIARTATFSPAGNWTTGGALHSATPVPTIPGYEILGELGRGGMGVVYKARQTALKRLVALKMILAGGHAAASELARFLAEAQAVARLQHPNIVQVHEIGEKDGLPYFSLEFVDGGTLAKRLSGTPLPPREAAQLTATIAQAIEAAHQAGIIHRDLKPANVLIAGTAATPLLQCVPKVADFGLAKTLDDDSGQTRTGAIMGTPSYMSPEQASGQTKDIGPATDVYALGAMLYEMLTGRPPFRAATIVETLEQVRSQEPVSPRSLQPTLPRDPETICLKCLAKEPAQRYPSAKELADDLLRYLNNQPIVARPASIQERAVKYVKRNRLLVGAASAIFLILLIGVIVSRSQAAQAREARDETEIKRKEAIKNLQDYLVESAERARQRGNLRDRLTILQDALAAGHPDRSRLRMEMARTHAALAEADEVRKIFDELEESGEAEKYEGSILLLRGYTTMGNKTQEGFKLIERALTKQLPKEEEAFARGLLAETSPKAVDFFREAIEADPYLEPARAMLGLTLFMLGRIDEADEMVRETLILYPDNPNFLILRGCILARNKNKREALKVIKKAEKQLTKTHYRVLLALVDFLDAGGRIDDPDGGVSAEQMAIMWAKLAPDIHSVWPIGPGQTPTDPEAGAAKLLQMPPVLNRSLGQLVQMFAVVTTDIRNETASLKLDQALRAHPEGTLYFVFGSIQFARGRYREASYQFQSAARVPGITRIQRTALSMAAAAESRAAFEKDQVVDEDMMKRCVQTIEELMKQGPLPNHEATSLFRLVLKAKKFDLARNIVASWESQGGADHPQVMRARMQAEAASGEHTLALQAADRLLKKAPNDAEALRIRASSLEEIRKTLKSAGE